MKAFLLAAGLGTRLKPFTEKHPKALAKVNGVTLLEWNIKRLQKYGINEFVINVHHFADQIETFLEANDGFGSRYHISDEREQLLETGGALLKAKPFLENTQHILMMNVDILSNIHLKHLIKYHLVHEPLVTLAIQKRASSRNLLFAKNENDELLLKGWKHNKTEEVKPAKLSETEVKQLNAFAFSGIQMINSEIYSHIQQTGKFSIIDSYLDLMSNNNIIGYDHTGDLMIDVGKPQAIAEAEKSFN